MLSPREESDSLLEPLKCLCTVKAYGEGCSEDSVTSLQTGYPSVHPSQAAEQDWEPHFECHDGTYVFWYTFEYFPVNV